MQLVLLFHYHRVVAEITCFVSSTWDVATLNLNSINQSTNQSRNRHVSHSRTKSYVYIIILSSPSLNK